MADKMEPAGYVTKDEPALSKGVGMLSLWGKPHPRDDAREWTALYTADQVKELKDRIAVLEKLCNETEAQALSEAYRAHTAETALAEARKVIEPFAKEATEWEKFDNEETLVEAFPGGPDTGITVGDLRAARAWLSSNPAKGGE